MKTPEDWETEAQEHDRMADLYKGMRADNSYQLRRDMAQMCRERAEEVRQQQRKKRP